MKSNPSQERITKEVSKSAITVAAVSKSEYQKEGTESAEIRQAVTTETSYPSKSVVNSLNGNIFTNADFGFEEQKYKNIEKRVAWIDVPEGTSLEEVKARLAENPEATLYRILSNKPILSDADEYAVNEPTLERSMDDYANSQAVRLPKGHPEEGQLALDTNGKVQYRRVAFAIAGQEDLDLRTPEVEDAYISEELKAEVNSMETIEHTPVTGQTL